MVQRYQYWKNGQNRIKHFGKTDKMIGGFIV